MDSDIGIFSSLSGFTIAVFSFEYYLSVRQLARYRDKRAKLPAPLEGYISTEKFNESLLYGADKLSFGMTESLIMMAESILLLLLGYLPYLWGKSEEICGWLGVCETVSYSDIFKEMVVTSIFLGLSMCHDTLISIPFSLYSTFVVEERHGFNKSTLALFFRDKFLGFVLTLIFGTPVLSGVVWLVRWGGQYFYFYVWAFLFAVSVLLLTIYPTVIAPLFNKYTKLESGPIYDAIEKLAKKLSFPLTQIYLVDGSRRSAHSNAYFYGFFKVRVSISV